MDIRRIFSGAFQDIFGTQETQTSQKTQQAQGILGTQQDLLEPGTAGAPSIGTTSQALTSGPTRIPDADKMPFLDQGTQNACGTTTLAMIMSYLTGKSFTTADIDSVIRRMNTFTSPNDIIEFARDNGLAAEGYNHGSFEEVKSMIDKGFPVQTLIQADKQGMGYNIDGQHYIAITGYETDPVTGEEFILYHDPNLGDDPATAAVEGGEQKMPVKEFERMWGNVGFGFDNYFMAFGPPGSTLPPGRNDGIEGVLGTLDGVTNITNGLDRIGSFDSVGSVVHGIFQFPGGLAQTIISGVGGLFSLGGQWLHDKLEGIPVLENILQPFADLIDTAGAVLGDLGNGVGEALDSWGGAFEDLFAGDFGGFASGIGEGIADVATGVADAVGDVVSGIGDAVGDLFSGW